MSTVQYSGKWASSGIEVTYVKSRRVVNVTGWYDSMVGLVPDEGQNVPLGDFLRGLGVTLADCKRALAEPKS